MALLLYSQVTMSVTLEEQRQPAQPSPVSISLFNRLVLLCLHQKNKCNYIFFRMICYQKEKAYKNQILGKRN